MSAVATKEPKTPELNRMAEVRVESQAIGDFLAWLQTEKKIKFAKYYGERLAPAQVPVEDTLAEFFEIDLKKVEKERQALLNFIRKKS